MRDDHKIHHAPYYEGRKTPESMAGWKNLDRNSQTLALASYDLDTRIFELQTRLNSQKLPAGGKEYFTRRLYDIDRRVSVESVLRYDDLIDGGGAGEEVIAENMRKISSINADLAEFEKEFRGAQAVNRLSPESSDGWGNLDADNQALAQAYYDLDIAVELAKEKLSDGTIPAKYLDRFKQRMYDIDMKIGKENILTDENILETNGVDSATVSEHMEKIQKIKSELDTWLVNVSDLFEVVAGANEGVRLVRDIKSKKEQIAGLLATLPFEIESQEAIMDSLSELDLLRENAQSMDIPWLKETMSNLDELQQYIEKRASLHKSFEAHRAQFNELKQRAGDLRAGQESVQEVVSHIETILARVADSADSALLERDLSLLKTKLRELEARIVQVEQEIKIVENRDVAPDQARAGSVFSRLKTSIAGLFGGNRQTKGVEVSPVLDEQTQDNWENIKAGVLNTVGAVHNLHNRKPETSGIEQTSTSGEELDREAKKKEARKVKFSSSEFLEIIGPEALKEFFGQVIAGDITEARQKMRGLFSELNGAGKQALTAKLRERGIEWEAFIENWNENADDYADQIYYFILSDLERRFEQKAREAAVQQAPAESGQTITQKVGALWSSFRTWANGAGKRTVIPSVAAGAVVATATVLAVGPGIAAAGLSMAAYSAVDHYFRGEEKKRQVKSKQGERRELLSQVVADYQAEMQDKSDVVLASLLASVNEDLSTFPSTEGDQRDTLLRQFNHRQNVCEELHRRARENGTEEERTNTLLDYSLAALDAKELGRSGQSMFSEKYLHLGGVMRTVSEIRDAISSGDIRNLFLTDENALKRYFGRAVGMAVQGAVGCTVGLAGYAAGAEVILSKAGVRLGVGFLKGFTGTSLRESSKERAAVVAEEKKKIEDWMKEHSIKKLRERIAAAQAPREIVEDNGESPEQTLLEEIRHEQIFLLSCLRAKQGTALHSLLAEMPDINAQLRALTIEYEIECEELANQYAYDRMGNALHGLDALSNQQADRLLDELEQRFASKKDGKRILKSILTGLRTGALVAGAGVMFDWVRNETNFFNDIRSYWRSMVGVGSGVEFERPSTVQHVVSEAGTARTVKVEHAMPAKVAAPAVQAHVIQPKVATSVQESAISKPVVPDEPQQPAAGTETVKVKPKFGGVLHRTGLQKITETDTEKVITSSTGRHGVLHRSKPIESAQYEDDGELPKDQTVIKTKSVGTGVLKKTEPVIRHTMEQQAEMEDISDNSALRSAGSVLDDFDKKHAGGLKIPGVNTEEEFEEWKIKELQRLGIFSQRTELPKGLKLEVETDKSGEVHLKLVIEKGGVFGINSKMERQVLKLINNAPDNLFKGKGFKEIDEWKLKEYARLFADGQEIPEGGKLQLVAGTDGQPKLEILDKDGNAVGISEQPAESEVKAPAVKAPAPVEDGEEVTEPPGDATEVRRESDASASASDVVASGVRGSVNTGRMPQATVDQRAVSFTEPASKMTPVKGPTTADYFASNASGPLEGGGGSGTNPEFDEVTLTRTKLSKADILKATWSTDSQVNKEINDFEKKLFGQKRDEKGYLIGPQQKEADETFDEAQFAVDNQDALSNYTDDEKKQYERIEKALEWQHEMFGDKGHDLRSWLEAQGISFQLPETRKKFFDIVSNHYEALRQFRLGTKGGWNFNALNTAVMRNMFGKEFVLSIDDLNKRYDFKKDIFEEKQQDALLKHFADEQRLTAVREAFRAQQQAGGK